jgi:tetratricopeptide (TPR) repeat protein
MNSLSTDAWAASRKSFADQFEQDGSGFIYRRSQKGEAIRVSADERSRFIDEFNRNLRRGMWMMYIALTLALGGVILFSVLRGTDLSQAAMFITIGVLMIPYLWYNRWAWGAPTRELAGRTPIAGERSPDEVRRLRFQRMNYRQLGIAALASLALPFMVSRREDVFSGWNRLWLAFSGALVLFLATQAFRKWRFEQDQSVSNTILPLSNPTVTDLTQDSDSSPSKTQLWRYVPLAVILLGGAFIALTPTGRQLAQTPSFWPILMIAFGMWAFYTVGRGFAKGQIEPMVRGVHATYERDGEPSRFWLSMFWNAVLGAFFLWVAVMGLRDAGTQSLGDRCSNEGHKYQPQEALSACDQVIAKGAGGQELTMADAYLDRGIARSDLNDPKQAIDDYSEALRLQPGHFEAHFDRGLSEVQAGENEQAVSDFSAAIRLKSDADAYYYRAEAYKQLGDINDATADFSVAFRMNPKLCGGCRTSDD